MHTKYLLLTGAAIIMGAAISPAMAQTAGVTTKTTTVVEPALDGGTVYESKTVTAPADLTERPVVFYYYDAKAGEIVAATTMTQEIFKIWDKDGNGYVSPQEYYRNEMVMYEPVETRTQVFSDVDGRLKLTQEEYTLRLQRIPAYAEINKDGKPGMSLHEFLGVGFQEADVNDDNKVSYSELTKAFYGQPRLASDQEIYND